MALAASYPNGQPSSHVASRWCLTLQDREGAGQQQQGNVFAAMMAAIQATQTNKVAQAMKEVKKQQELRQSDITDLS